VAEPRWVFDSDGDVSHGPIMSRQLA
jgi:hypothetical protein